MSVGAVTATTAGSRQLIQSTQTTAGPSYIGSAIPGRADRQLMIELAKG